MIDGDGMVRGSYDVAEQVERLGVTPGSTLQAVLFHFAGGRRVPENMVREALAQLRRRRNLTAQGRAAVEAFAATLAPAPPAEKGVPGSARLSVLLASFARESPSIRAVSETWRRGERAPVPLVEQALADLARVQTSDWYAGQLRDAQRETAEALEWGVRRKPNSSQEHERVDAGLHYPSARGLVFDETAIDNEMRAATRSLATPRAVLNGWLSAQNFIRVEPLYNVDGIRSAPDDRGDRNILFHSQGSEFWMPAGFQYHGIAVPAQDELGVGFVQVMRNFVYVVWWHDFTPLEKRGEVWFGDIRMKRCNFGTIESFAERLLSIYRERAARPESEDSRQDRENVRSMYGKIDNERLQALVTRLAGTEDPRQRMQRDVACEILAARRAGRPR